MAKKAKKIVKKVSQATLTRRRNKMFGESKKHLEEQVKRLSDKNEEITKATKLALEDQQRKHNIAQEDWNRERAQLKDIERTLTQKFNDEKALAYKSMELEFKGKQMDEVNKIRLEADAKLQRGIEENFNKLKDSLAKLHEEGNAQTKFTEQIALKMMGTLRPDSSKTQIASAEVEVIK